MGTKKVLNKYGDYIIYLTGLYKAGSSCPLASMESRSPRNLPECDGFNAFYSCVSHTLSVFASFHLYLFERKQRDELKKME